MQVPTCYPTSMTAVREPAAASAVVEAAAAAWWYSGVGLWLFMKCLFLAPRGSHFGAVGAALAARSLGLDRLGKSSPIPYPIRWEITGCHSLTAWAGVKQCHKSCHGSHGPLKEPAAAILRRGREGEDGIEGGSLILCGLLTELGINI